MKNEGHGSREAPTTFATYRDFFAFYVRQHSDLGNRILHACGTLIGLTIATLAICFHHAWWALLGLPVAYTFAWIGHFCVEGNRPATFGHPFWSFISDFRMLGLMLTGRLGKWLS